MDLESTKKKKGEQLFEDAHLLVHFTLVLQEHVNVLLTAKYAANITKNRGIPG